MLGDRDTERTGVRGSSERERNTEKGSGKVSEPDETQGGGKDELKERICHFCSPLTRPHGASGKARRVSLMSSGSYLWRADIDLNTASRTPPPCCGQMAQNDAPNFLLCSHLEEFDF